MGRIFNFSPFRTEFFTAKTNAVPLILFFSVMLLQCSRENDQLKVGIQLFNNFDQSLAGNISDALEKNYGLKTYILPSTKIPEEAFVNTKTPRYRADKIIQILIKQKPDSLDFVLGLTNEDISMTKFENGEIKEPRNKYEDFGVFGLGYVSGPSSVVSSFRLKERGRTILIERLKKIATHELGHNMGLDHCNSEGCVMTDAAESIKTVDRAGTQLCDKCKRNI